MVFYFFAFLSFTASFCQIPNIIIILTEYKNIMLDNKENAEWIIRNK